MPYRSDASLWFNLPGVVAAYQPIAAPGPLLARYNQAHGGDNGYKAIDGTPPTWHGATGWTFAGSQYLNTGLVPTINQTWSVLLRIVSTNSINTTFLFTRGGTNKDFGWYFGSATLVYFYNGGTQNQTTTTLATDTVLGVSGKNCFQNGVQFATVIAAGSPPTTQPIYIGAGNNNGTPAFYGSGRVLAIGIYARNLSIAEMWRASRQMAYCHVNPDWSAWGRRRRYYYAPEVAAAGSVGIYGKRGALALPGGVRIEAVQ